MIYLHSLYDELIFFSLLMDFVYGHGHVYPTSNWYGGGVRGSWEGGNYGRPNNFNLKDERS